MTNKLISADDIVFYFTTLIIQQYPRRHQGVNSYIFYDDCMEKRGLLGVHEVFLRFDLVP